MVGDVHQRWHDRNGRVGSRVPLTQKAEASGDESVLLATSTTASNATPTAALASILPSPSAHLQHAGGDAVVHLH
jgi:hypothetical protein